MPDCLAFSVLLGRRWRWKDLSRTLQARIGVAEGLRLTRIERRLRCLGHSLLILLSKIAPNRRAYLVTRYAAGDGAHNAGHRASAKGAAKVATPNGAGNTAQYAAKTPRVR